MHRHSKLACALTIAPLLTALGCGSDGNGENRPNDDTVGPATTDAGITRGDDRDTTVGAGPAVIGPLCAFNEDCGEGLHCERPGDFCTRGCTEHGQCPDGRCEFNSDGDAVCFPLCERLGPDRPDQFVCTRGIPCLGVDASDCPACGCLACGCPEGLTCSPLGDCGPGEAS